MSKPSLGRYELDAVAAVLNGGWITQGPVVEAFEDRLAEWLNVDHVVACASGTAALHMAMMDLHLSPGDEVLIPDVTYIATANAVLYAGAKPVFVDVDKASWNIDLEHAERLITARTCAIMPVHLYGVPCDMAAVVEFANRHGLEVVEDAAEALGARYARRACGTIGSVGCFSFYGNKVLTTGEGGAVVTNTPQQAAHLRLLRGQGQSRTQRFVHTEMGFNYRMTDVAAAMGLAQLMQLDNFLAQRNDVVNTYVADLEDVLTLQVPPKEGAVAPWLFTGLLPRHVSREEVCAALAAQGIETRPVFTPLHRQPYLQTQGGDEAFPMACDVADRGLSLPTYAELEVEGAQEIARALRKAVGA